MKVPISRERFSHFLQPTKINYLDPLPPSAIKPAQLAMTVNHETASSDGPAVEESETYTPVGPSKAIQANNAAAVPEVLKSLSEFGSSPLVEDNDVRLRMLVQAKALVRALETPRETMIKHNWAQVRGLKYQNDSI